MDKRLLDGIRRSGAGMPGFQFDALVTDEELRALVEPLFRSREYSRAVEEAYKFLDNLVRHRACLEGSGASLMTQAFGQKSPRLLLNALETQSERSEQLGYMKILEGCMIAIRNPRAHENGNLDSPAQAVVLLAWANHLVSLVRQAKTAGTTTQPDRAD